MEHPGGRPLPDQQTTWDLNGVPVRELAGHLRHLRVALAAASSSTRGRRRARSVHLLHLAL
eukprot:14239049-Heterocapsa_arctica.AAC.1